ncbi:winged helix-turn-helix transcriptional regulator [Halobacteria archaeon AArc-dxtr1]|nr:winged helix-turn-helix transcriptional regulator [Halobacteria archaeon AArc-dxtr1]
MSAAEAKPAADRKAEIVSAVENLVAAEVTDTVGGGAPSTAIAEETGLARKTVENYLKRLLEAGRVERVYGVGPHGPRYNYLPGDSE